VFGKAFVVMTWLAVAVVGSTWAKDSEQLFTEAFELLKKGKSEQAAIEFEAGLKSEPENVAAQYFLGEAYWEMGDKEKATDQFRKSLSLDSSGFIGTIAKQKLIELGVTEDSEEQEELTDEDTVDAVDIASAVPNNTSDTSSAMDRKASQLFFDGFELLRKGQASEAADKFNQGIRIEPKKVSSPGESHPQALAEPDGRVSTHPAPIIQPHAHSNEEIAPEPLRECALTIATRAVDAISIEGTYVVPSARDNNQDGTTPGKSLTGRTDRNSESSRERLKPHVRPVPPVVCHSKDAAASVASSDAF
jgi:tetratricopeptide (TPR) repeat protein